MSHSIPFLQQPFGAALFSCVRSTSYFTWEQEPPSSRVSSYFSGEPYAEEGESWPICQHCHSHLQFIGQWNQADGFHSFSTETTLFTLFWCNNRSDEHPFYGCKNPFGLGSVEGNVCLRFYENPSLDKAVPLIKKPWYHSLPSGLFIFTKTEKKREIVVQIKTKMRPSLAPFKIQMQPGWLLPDLNHFLSKESSLSKQEEGLFLQTYDAIKKKQQEDGKRKIGHALPDFLGGYPQWTNFLDRTPTCPACELKMSHLIQFYDFNMPEGIHMYEQVSFFYCPLHLMHIQAVFDYT